jgi:opacity protein-like surface antigen
MKNVKVALGIMASIAIFANAENIDGTLAVDSGNALSSAKQTAQEQTNKLSANLDNGYDQTTAKDSVEASSVPVAPTNVGLSSYNEGPFVGVEGNAVLSSETQKENGDLVDSSGMSWGIRFGAQNSEWRTMAIIEKFGTDGELNSYVRGLLQFDYYFLGTDNLMIDSYAIRPYAGVNFGALSIDTDEENDLKTLTYGGQLGATMSVTQNIDLDLGYRYNMATSDKVDHTHGLSVGINYKY